MICFVLVSLDLGEGETLVELLFLFFFCNEARTGKGSLVKLGCKIYISSHWCMIYAF